MNAPQSYWPDVIQKKKDKKRSKYVALDFFTHFLFFIYLFFFFIFVNLREGEKNSKKQIQKKKQIRSLRFFRKNKSKKKIKKKQIRSRIGLCGSFLGGCRISIAETVNGSKRPMMDGRTDSCVKIKRVSRGC
jgi:hypothetical protein